jgi:hypothetical protein
MRTFVLHADLHDDAWNQRVREESSVQRLDRNWADLVQELRVLQTGVQLLTGFLLILPFQNRFHELTPTQVAIYLTTVASAVGATGCLIAPVSMHRILFRMHARRPLVSLAHRLLQLGLLLLATATIGVVLLVFDVVGGPSLLATTVAASALVVLWLAVPLWIRRRVRAAQPRVDRVERSRDMGGLAGDPRPARADRYATLGRRIATVPAAQHISPAEQHR